MNEAQAEERYRNLMNTWEKFLRGVERKKGEKIIQDKDGIRFKSQFESEKERWKIEEDTSCGS